MVWFNVVRFIIFLYGLNRYWTYVSHYDLALKCTISIYANFVDIPSHGICSIVMLVQNLTAYPARCGCYSISLLSSLGFLIIPDSRILENGARIYKRLLAVLW